MAIEFNCEQCRQLVRTPEAAAGKKGKCPHCGAVMQIPSPPAAAGPQPAGDELGLADDPPAKPAAPVIPQSTASPPVTLKSVPGNSAALSAAAVKPTAAGTIDFPCPSCHKSVRTPAAMAGKKGRCPHCSTVLQIPAKPAAAPVRPEAYKPKQPAAAAIKTTPAKTAAAAPAKPLPSLTPVTDDLPELAPISQSGLTPLQPLSIPGLTPLGPVQTGLPELQPLGPIGGAVPLSPAYGGDPLGGFADPLASLPAVGTGTVARGLSSNSLRTYQSPAKSFTHVPRTGLPWEAAGAGGESFFDTAMLLLFRPGIAFQRVHRARGLNDPMGFAVAGVLSGWLITVLYFLIASFLAILFSGLIDAISGQKVAVFLFGTVGYTIGIIVSTVVGTLVTAAVYHLCLLVVGSGKSGFEATYRVYAYSLGAVSLWMVLPIIGLFIMPWHLLILNIIGYKHVHEGEYWQGIVAALLPSAAVMFCCGGMNLLGLFLR